MCERQLVFVDTRVLYNISTKNDVKNNALELLKQVNRILTGNDPDESGHYDYRLINFYQSIVVTSNSESLFQNDNLNPDPAKIKGRLSVYTFLTANTQTNEVASLGFLSVRSTECSQTPVFVYTTTMESPVQLSTAPPVFIDAFSNRCLVLCDPGEDKLSLYEQDEEEPDKLNVVDDLVLSQSFSVH